MHMLDSLRPFGSTNSQPLSARESPPLPSAAELLPRGTHAAAASPRALFHTVGGEVDYDRRQRWTVVRSTDDFEDAMSQPVPATRRSSIVSMVSSVGAALRAAVGIADPDAADLVAASAPNLTTTTTAAAAAAALSSEASHPPEPFTAGGPPAPLQAKLGSTPERALAAFPSPATSVGSLVPEDTADDPPDSVVARRRRAAAAAAVLDAAPASPISSASVAATAATSATAAGVGSAVATFGGDGLSTRAAAWAWAAGATAWAATKAVRSAEWAGTAVGGRAAAVLAGRREALFDARDAAIGAAAGALDRCARGMGLKSTHVYPVPSAIPAVGLSSSRSSSSSLLSSSTIAAATMSCTSRRDVWWWESFVPDHDAATTAAEELNDVAPSVAASEGNAPPSRHRPRSLAVSQLVWAAAGAVTRPAESFRRGKDAVGAAIGAALRPAHRTVVAESFRSMAVLPQRRDSTPSVEVAASAAVAVASGEGAEACHARRAAELGVRSPPSFSFGSSRLGALGVAAGRSAAAEAFRADVLYAAGVGAAVLDSWEPRVVAAARFLGCGPGAVVAAVLACGLGVDGLDALSKAVERWSAASGERLFGPVATSAEFLRRELDHILPEDVSAASGRLYISVTQFPSMENDMLFEFSSKEELMSAILESCDAPVLHEHTAPAPIRIAAGALSDRLPVYDARTLAASRLHGDGDIGPAPGEAAPAGPEARSRGEADAQRCFERLKASGHVTLRAFRSFW
ncbi:Patatin-like phospholipase domain-containing protein 1 [Cladochytrium tenue]|nr:Patatin-like phospholipase domain-containing protein 1 [Cladochytrium tenue]